MGKYRVLKLLVVLSLTVVMVGGGAFGRSAAGATGSDGVSQRGVLPPFVTVDLERTARGLPPVPVLSRSLDTIAQAGAQADQDPALARVARALPGGGRTGYLGATWSGGWVNPLGSDYGWTYDDGPGGTNEGCRTAGSALCWGHRDIILVAFGTSACGGGPAELAMGAGHVLQAGRYGESDTEILAGVCGPTPTDAGSTTALVEWLDNVAWLGMAALPVSMGVAILRYRLYEIDRIIARTLAYTVVTGLLVATYAGLVLLFTDVLTLSSSVAVAASTLVAAAPFNPLRKRVQRVVDRRFNRARHDADLAVAAFGPAPGRAGPGLGAVRPGQRGDQDAGARTPVGVAR